MESSKSILAAQESYESKQDNMCDALDKLFCFARCHVARIMNDESFLHLLYKFLSSTC
ncbi:hypothetical protein TanjilG_05319 [Lupinus angustifolius]|uniref:Uncharacterized protein n=1 Tax=Lupinus angustifolius TaxID=3871 RepID=A0A1J7IGX6_LUPAN|nr:hypothetical protein TanjilG_05319 [Lupinus angustifolius]